MIITCPECETRYTVKAAAFKAPGRKVRCANCGHEWFQAPPEDAPLSVEPPQPAPEAEDAPAARVRPDPEPEDDPVPETGEEDETLGQQAPDASSDARSAASAASATDAEKRKPRAGGRSRASLFGWIALVGVVIMLCGAGVAFRGDVVRIWPATAALYEAVGLPVAVKGMEFRRVVYERTVENGLTVLSISGEIVNVAEERGEVPRVRVSLRDGDGAELYHYFFAIPENELDAGETAEFVTRLSSPPSAARDLVLRFVEPGEFAPPDAAANGS